jgi:hypothetical protein
MKNLYSHPSGNTFLIGEKVVAHACLGIFSGKTPNYVENLQQSPYFDM